MHLDTINQPLQLPSGTRHTQSRWMAEAGLAALALSVLSSVPGALAAQAPAESVRQLAAYGAALLPEADRTSPPATGMALTGDFTAPWSAEELVTPFTGLGGESGSSVSADDDSEGEGRRKGTYILAGSALAGGALLFNFASGGGDAFPADNGLIENNTFLDQTVRPSGPPTTQGTPPQFGEVPFADQHPTCSDPLSSSCPEPVLLGAPNDSANVVPEPLTMTMVATGLIGMAAVRRRRAA